MAEEKSAAQRIADALERIADALEAGSKIQNHSKPIGVIFAKADTAILQFVTGEKATEAREIMGVIQRKLQQYPELQPNTAADLAKLYTPRSFTLWVEKEIAKMLDPMVLAHNSSNLEAAGYIADALETAGMWNE
jgi:ATP-dependent exoDNAse (exonuclease V) beta subunit